LRFGNYFGEAELGGRRLRVTSGRLGDGALEQMLADVEERFCTLPFFAAQPSGHGYARDRIDGPDVLYQTFMVLRHAMHGGPPHDLPAAMARILARPHESLVDGREDMPLAFARGVDGTTLIEIASRPDRLVSLAPGHALSRSPGARALKGRLPTDVRSRRARSTTDTRENRFICAVIDALIDVCLKVESSAKLAKLASGTTVAQEASGYVRRLERWRRHPVLDGLSADPAIPAQSTVLQGRPGYRHVYGFVGDLAGRTRLLNAETATRLMDLRDAATTYEVWCYFAVVQSLEHVLGEPAALAQAFTDDAGVNMPRGHVARVGPVEVRYNFAFSPSKGHGRHPRRSYSVLLRPDISLFLDDGSLHVFDAKLKRDVRTVMQQSMTGEVDEPAAPADLVTFARPDLHKMHAYRDALGARSVWVLYPGSEDVVDSYPDTEGAPAVNGGVGAIALAPAQSAASLTGVLGAMLD
jgi:predicted component of viral defense system (DUF524 family)